METEINFEGSGPRRGGLFGWGDEGYLVSIDLTFADVQFWPLSNELLPPEPVSRQFFSFEFPLASIDGANHLQLISSRAELWVYVNGELVGYSDKVPGVGMGKVGFHVSSFTDDGMVASFDNFVIRSVSPEIGPTGVNNSLPHASNAAPMLSGFRQVMMGLGSGIPTEWSIQ